jgi:four helix bundle protein
MDKPHKKLDAWKQSMELVVDVYQITNQFPPQERYGLIDQIRRAAISIPSDIAEGAARQTGREFANYLHIAQGSLSELDTQVELARQLDYINAANYKLLDERSTRIDKMITGLIHHLAKR